MAPNRINTRLPEPLAEHIARVVGPKGLYETPGEYIRSLIRRDMESETFQGYREILKGFEDFAQGRVYESTGDWEQDKKIFEEKEKNGWE